MSEAPKGTPMPPIGDALPLCGDTQAFNMFRAFVRDNAPALRMVAHWGDGECGALLDVLRTELQGWQLPAQSPVAEPEVMPLFPEDGGVS